MRRSFHHGIEHLEVLDVSTLLDGLERFSTFPLVLRDTAIAQVLERTELPPLLHTKCHTKQGVRLRSAQMMMMSFMLGAKALFASCPVSLCPRLSTFTLALNKDQTT